MSKTKKEKKSGIRQKGHMPRKCAREKILDAAEQVVILVGAGHLTLSAIAKKAGVSKGGLIYYFPSKTALLKGMIERLISRSESRQTSREIQLPAGKSCAIKAHILNASLRRPDRKPMRIALLAASAHNPRLLEPAREAYRRQFARFIANGLRPERAGIIAFAVDGMWLLDLLDIMPIPRSQINSVIQELLKLADE
ncbi:MAG: HTH-type transcriptional regulator BetI [candidate division TA06 bacterium ADurb.Bin131]|uniref:HTH-type transcriptional regulator BetI n=1 Tax=candidate division TA06 bacterium ADurb.Bin131 TaxID=1852827 RepID=A0A1V6CES8_UNCT6|nr:MAG: HTH-type transcriptional regulator BetI [candidate division TA06 bacterium ADurb.Bin131]HQL64577.1 TetR/AcrR family transcriptional regulator [bacterium]